MATSSNGAMKLCDNTKDKLQLLVQHGAEGIFQSAIEWYHEKKKKKREKRWQVQYQQPFLQARRYDESFAAAATTC